MKYNKSEIMKNAWTIRRTENTNMSSALKKAWAMAKNKEENNMENEKIKAIIDKWHLERRGEMIGTSQTKGIDKEAFMREVAPHKDEIKAYFMAQEKAASDLLAKKIATFEAIPGVAELRKARTQRAAWKREFNRMMETGSSKMPYVEAPTADDLAALEARYPMAVFALEAKYRAANTANLELSSIWTETYDALCDGKDTEMVKADHDARMSAYTNKHLWD